MFLEGALKEPDGEARHEKISADIEEFAKLKEQIGEAEAAIQVELDKLGCAEGLERRKKLMGQAEKAGVNKFFSRWLGVGRTDQGEFVLKQLEDEFGIELGGIRGQKKAVKSAEASLAQLEKQKEALNKAKEALVVAAGGEKAIFKVIQISVARRMADLVGTDIHEARKVHEALTKASEGGLDYLAQARAGGLTEAAIEAEVAKTVEKEVEEVFQTLPIRENGALRALEKGLKDILKKDSTDTGAKKRLLEILEKNKSALRKTDRAKAILVARTIAKLYESMF